MKVRGTLIGSSSGVVGSVHISGCVAFISASGIRIWTSLKTTESKAGHRKTNQTRSPTPARSSTSTLNRQVKSIMINPEHKGLIYFFSTSWSYKPITRTSALTRCIVKRMIAAGNALWLCFHWLMDFTCCRAGFPHNLYRHGVTRNSFANIWIVTNDWVAFSLASWSEFCRSSQSFS